MLILLTTIHVIVCLFLILVVLLQQGKGADLSVFGGGSTQAAFGARGAATLLHKLTVAGFVAFILTTTGIGFLKSGGSSSVMSGVGQEVEAEAEASAEDGAEPASEAGTPAAEAAPPDTGAAMAPTETESEPSADTSSEGEAPAESSPDGG